MSRLAFTFACLLLAGVCTPALAEVFTYVDADGNRVYTDQPKPGNAKRVEMAPLNKMPAVKRLSPPRPPAKAPVEPPYQVLRILFPAPDSVVEDAAGNLMVTINSEPALLPGHSYRLLFDGTQVGQPGRSAVFPLENLERGTHQLAVEIIDSQGLVVERTPSQPVHVRRVSLDSKRRAQPCKLPDYGVRPECALKDRPEPDNDIPFIPFI
ncbi:protein of unknown function [Pseudomonas pohangensis]|uniref:DUF4124 domain-containing protein n=1 Tax=Pseudomonas pohangensis TaxID=364197 RepID=A0A1H2HHI7_9PSED|nr:DUF4124 domain-containing protein [Pseudomonas pohangensis]SDU31347.1 protein of unknown function [Pseudomonas pohangensis]